MRLAALDIGSNSIHMLVAQVEPEGNFRVLDRAKEMVRLGRKSLTTGKLSKDAMERGVKTLAAFRTLAERQGATRFRAVATSAVREAKNGGEFLQRVRDEIGLRVRVIPGREEARLVWLGVSNSIDLRGEPSVILDAGGGSVEIVAVEGGQATAMSSLKLGVARLTETFLERDPPGARALKRLDAHLAESLDPVLEPLASRGVGRLIGTSGTMLSLVAAAAHRLGVETGGRLHNLEVPAAEIRRLHETLRTLPREARQKLKGIDSRRADLVVAGAAVAAHVVRRLKPRTVVACTWALREGLLLDYIARHGKGIEESVRFTDVRRRSVMRLLRRLGQTGHHHHRVARTALRLFDQLAARLGLSASDRELLEYAALLHDVGHAIAHADHPHHSYYLIVHGELLGFTREEIEVVGQVARMHDRKGGGRSFPKDRPALPRKRRAAVRGMAALLRLAEGLDRSHYGVVSDVRARFRRGGLSLELVTDGHDAELEIWESTRRTELLEKLLEMPVSIRAARTR